MFYQSAAWSRYHADIAAAADNPAKPASGAKLAGVVALLVAVAFVVHSSAWSFLCDDAFISFRYAENLANDGALVFNPGERVEGYTNFLWVVLLAVPSALGIRPHVAAPMFTTVAAAAGLLAAAVLLRRLRGARGRGLSASDFAGSILLVALPEYMVWSHGGLETAAVAALVLCAMAAWMGGRLPWAAGLAAAAGLMRPDALLPIAVFGVAWLGVYGFARRREAVPWRRVAIAAAVFAIPLCGHLLFRLAYYGAWVPNTWTIKAHGALLRPTYGQAYVQAWVDAVHLLWLAPLALLLRPRHVILVAPIAAIVAYGWWVGGDFMAYSRFYIVATALLAVLVGWLLCDFAAWLGVRSHGSRTDERGARRETEGSARGRTADGATAPGGPSARGGSRARSIIGSLVPLVAAAAFAGLLGREARERHALDVERGPKWLDGKWEGVNAMKLFAEYGLAAGSWMKANLPEDTVITVGAAGAVPYGAGLATIDAYGLVDPVIASLPEAGPIKKGRPGHQLQAPKRYIVERDPDLLCHVGYRGPKKPRHVPRGYGRGYAWACMELEVGFYCCRRPTDRAVGPFGRRPSG